MRRIAIGCLLLLILVSACTKNDKPIPVEPDGGIGSTPDGSGGAAGTMPELKLRAIECTAEQRAAEACTLEYAPVCGYPSQDIQCVKAPCARTYGNACTACADDNVTYYTEGECQSDEDLAAK